MVARSGLFVAPAAGPVGSSPTDARLALTGLLGTAPQVVSGGAITQSASVMQFSIAAGVWQLPDVTNASATFLSPTDPVVLTGTAGPGTGSRIDLIVAKQNNVENSDADSRANVYLVAGTAGAPGVAPAVPAGALLVAQVTVPTAAANAAACTVVLWNATVLAPPVRIAQTLAALTATHPSVTPAGARATVAADGANNGDYLYVTGTGWVRIAAPGATPYATASGVQTGSATGGTSAPLFWGGSLTVAFPTGLFTVAPFVQATVNSAGICFATVSNVTTTGCNIVVTRVGAYPATTEIAQWTAVQMTSTSAAG